MSTQEFRSSRTSSSRADVRDRLEQRTGRAQREHGRGDGGHQQQTPLTQHDRVERWLREEQREAERAMGHGRAGTKARSIPRSASAAHAMLASIQIQPAVSSVTIASGATAKP